MHWTVLIWIKLQDLLKALINVCVCLCVGCEKNCAMVVVGYICPFVRISNFYQKLSCLVKLLRVMHDINQ